MVLSFASILIYYGLSFLLLLFIPLSILIWVWIQKGWGKELVKKNPAPEIEEFFDKWKKEELERK